MTCVAHPSVDPRENTTQTKGSRGRGKRGPTNLGACLSDVVKHRVLMANVRLHQPADQEMTATNRAGWGGGYSQEEGPQGDQEAEGWGARVRAFNRVPREGWGRLGSPEVAG